MMVMSWSRDRLSEAVPSPVSRQYEIFGDFFDELPESCRRPVFLWRDGPWRHFPVEEFEEGGTFVLRVDIAGLDPERDVDVQVRDGILHIRAERRLSQDVDNRSYLLRELPYGALELDIPLAGTSDGDLAAVTATYRDGVLEIRVPPPAWASGATTSVPVLRR